MALRESNSMSSFLFDILYVIGQTEKRLIIERGRESNERLQIQKNNKASTKRLLFLGRPPVAPRLALAHGIQL